MKNCPDGSHCQNEYLIEDLEQEVAIRTVEYDEAKELADDLYLLLVDDPRTKAMADEVIRLHQARKTTPYTYTLRQRIDELTAENARLKEANEDVQSRLDDYRQDYAKVVNDNCPTDEIHCGCVPILRREMRLREEENKSRLVYIVTMYRYGDREKHSYVYGAFSTEATAREWGEEEKDYRGGKYEPEIIRFCIDSPTDFLKVKNG